MKNNELPKRKQNRLNNYDYGQNGCYFVTVCTKDRKQILSKIAVDNETSLTPLVGDDAHIVPKNHAQTKRNGVGDGVLDVPHNSPQIELFECGKIAEKYLKQINDFYNDISVDKYIIMPDHIHFILSVNGAHPDGMSRTPDGMSRTPSPTVAKTNSAVARFVSTFKRFSHKEIGKPIFQRSYYDHIIRDQNDYNEKWEYIENNPQKCILANNGETMKQY